ncbi:response regulator transcription factor [Micromonospora sp. NPDC051296]|uniref:response regulator transcription factor n=1 Tax=Micromonospora sp. NPDC051296 TaxID=3155046 RepID=UPI00343537EE
MPQSAALRVAVVDDHPIFVCGLELLLPTATAGRARVVGSTVDAAAAASLVSRCLPDLVLVDLHMPAPGGVRAVGAIRRTTPRVRVVAMADTDDLTSPLAALRAGAEALVPKSAEPEELLPPLLAVLDGWAVLPAQMLRTLLRPGRVPPADLDAAERTLLRSIAAGRSTLAIADQMHVSDRTVKRMTAALLRKLRVSSRAEAAALAGHAGLLDD